MCCSVLQCVAVRCSALQCVAMCCNVLQYVAMCCSALHCVAVFTCDKTHPILSVLQCVAVCWRPSNLGSLFIIVTVLLDSLSHI